MPVKGDAIRIVNGKYAGCTGWRDTSRKHKKGNRKRPVIVLLHGEEIATDVYKSSIRRPHGPPRSFEEAALQQHSDVETAMVKLAAMIAQFGLSDNVKMINIFDAELKLAREEQVRLKNKARYRHVVFQLAQLASSS